MLNIFKKSFWLPREEGTDYPSASKLPIRISKMFKKAFWVPYEDGTVYPTIAKAHHAIEQYCIKNGHSYTFTGDETVIIDGIEHEICRGYEYGCRGYGVKCREK